MSSAHGYKICDLADKLVAEIEADGGVADFTRYLADNPELIRRASTYRVERREPGCAYPWTAAHAAARHGRGDVLAMFAKAACWLEGHDERKRAPVWYAARYGHLEVVRLLVEAGVKFKYGDSDGWSPLHAASRYGHLEVVKFLVCHDSPVNHCDTIGWTPLHKAVWGDHLEVCQYLVRFGASVSAATFNDRVTPLHLACYRLNVPAVRLFLAKTGGDISQGSAKGLTPLMVAAQLGSHELVDYLIFSGASPNEHTAWQSTPLHYATEGGHASVAALLMRKGADPDRVNRQGWTPFLLGARHGHRDICQALRLKGASPHAVLRPHGYTAVHLACMSGDPDTLAYLVEDLALPVDSRDTQGRTPVHLCAVRGFTDCAQLLLSQGAPVSGRDNRGRSPVHLATLAGYVGLARQLILNGASLWDALKALFWTAKLKME